MPSVFFNNYQNFQEQTLLEDLIIESISIHGIQGYYCPRTLVAKDDVYGEDPLSVYNVSYDIDMYLDEVMNYSGDGTFLSKINLEIRDQTKISLARRTFAKEIGQYENLERPREGDLIYIPMMKRLFVIMYVDNTPTFYQMGSLQTWRLTLEVFEYSNERFSTGVEEIDQIEVDYSTDRQQFGISTDDGGILVDQNGDTIVDGSFDFDKQMKDVFADNDEIREESEGVIDWTNGNPFEDD